MKYLVKTQPAKEFTAPTLLLWECIYHWEKFDFHFIFSIDMHSA
jgi:hypothetical protein